MNRKTGKLVEAPSVTYKDQVDGIVGPNTRDEIAVWKRENFIRPLPTLYHGDYDREGVSHGKGKRGTDEYHEKNDPVVEAQKKLKQVGAYGGEEDGWFFDKMQDAVKVFQEYAEKGQFLVDGVITDIGEKLTGFVKGEFGPETQEFVKKVGEKKGKVPRQDVRCLKKGDKGKAVEEINIRLSGFGGGVPTDTFDAVTETKVKNFQRGYMKMKNPLGVVDENTANSIDEFGEVYPEDLSDYKCPCGKCTGFGNRKHKGEYRADKKQEKYHKYEYPGIHRSLLWLIRGLRFYLSQQNPELKIGKVSSGYRCWIDNEAKKRTSTNHMGKAADLHIYSKTADGSWVNGAKTKCDEARQVLTRRTSAQTRWSGVNRFSLEPSEAIYEGEFLATTWVHIDVRTFEPDQFLDDKYFAKSAEEMNGEPIKKIMGGH